MAEKQLAFNSVTTQLEPGITLVEASAGTGKTYAIGMLVLRFITEKDIPVTDILLVTFTKAATEELRGRIRSKLRLAYIALGGGHVDVDDTMRHWLDVARSGGAVEQMMRRLEKALLEIDQAPIFTIHGFCQRTLKEQPLESGQLFDTELSSDTERWRMEVITDYWRRKLYGADPAVCSLLLENFATPGDFALTLPAVSGDVTIEPVSHGFNQVCTIFLRAKKVLAEWWGRNSSGLHEAFLAALSQDVFKVALRDNFTEWWTGIETFLMDKGGKYPSNIGWLDKSELIGQLNGNKIRGKDKQQNYFQSWPLPEEEIRQLLTAARQLPLTLRLDIGGELEQALESKLQAKNIMSYDDLITRLSRGLEGEKGGSLRQQLRAKYPVAMVDEFQDTDRQQWQIFQSAFGGRNQFLFLIGDPKQAIYKFRGADIHAYFSACKMADHIYTLLTNYRSHPDLVNEINTIFTLRQQPFGLESELMQYSQVAAGQAVDTLLLTSKSNKQPSTLYCTLPQNPQKSDGRWSSGSATEYIQQFMVAEISKLLFTPEIELHEDEEKRSVQPGDIAILVRSHSQAESIQRLLLQNGIPAVVSSKLSVFSTKECHALLTLLCSIASPHDKGLLRTAMSLEWFGMTGDQLFIIWEDEQQENSWIDEFLQYQNMWRESGFLRMITALFTDHGLYAKIGKQPFAERVLTNLQHLFELIQEKEVAGRFGVGQTIQWLQAASSVESGNENELRLESDAAALQIVTMHSAKGLQYQIVFCPFLWYRGTRLKGQKDYVRVNDSATGQTITDYGSVNFQQRKEQALAEELSEELRLAYVSLTRAKVRNYIFWADVSGQRHIHDGFQSALGYLLFPGGKCGFDQQHQTFSSLVEQGDAQVIVVGKEQLEWSGSEKKKLPEKDISPKPMGSRNLYSHWQVSSYSSLVSDSVERHDIQPENLPAGQSLIPVRGLPAGAGFGNVIHDILENCSFADIGKDQISHSLYEDVCFQHGVSLDINSLRSLLHNIVSVELSFELHGALKRFCLAELEEKKVRKEMPFYFGLAQGNTETINLLLADEEGVSRISSKVLQGYLRGFMDLVFFWEGKYYLLDYKTNYLGDALQNYHRDKLVESMTQHNYGLQYWIYSAVLHRYLQINVPDYTYTDSFGGVIYLFVRGMSPKDEGSGVYHHLPDEGKLAELLAILGENHAF